MVTKKDHSVAAVTAPRSTDDESHDQTPYRRDSEAAPRSATHVAFLGPAGTFCEQALLATPELAGCVLTARSTITEAVRAVRNGTAVLAFVPIENSIAGPVEETMAALGEARELEIVLETTIQIHLGLLAVRGTSVDSILRVYSHPAAISECQRFLAERLHGVEIEETESTSAAARRVREIASLEAAAIASETNAELYELEILARSIEDRPDNRTRFVALGKRPVQKSPSALGNEG
jgi:prephenate dehydratase